MTRAWRSRPLVREHDGRALWAGPLPDGPIVRLDDMAALLLDTLVEETTPGEGEGAAMTSGEILDRLRDVLEAPPADAEAVVERFFADLEAVGLAERAARCPGGGSTPSSPLPEDPNLSEPRA